MPSLKIFGLPVLEENIFKVSTIYGHGGRLGHVTWTIYINICSPFPRRLHMKFVALIDQAVQKMFENGGHIQVYSPGAGAVSQFSPLLQVFPIQR